ncbi:type IV toxin-antitoxin system AbiEi family antitoxin domain-containing protein [Candidatus Poriferisocius sp.]|uniref:type IV toxin-antitoxin system AbiEi family antitoxin domain-containing protein n=1 Tax=Candidatus Poriferisocius sp. TaxID=3101276 RepID=UPI003B5BA094
MSVPSQISKTSIVLEFDSLSGVHQAKVAPNDLADWLVGQGRHFISSAEVADILGINRASVPGSLERARKSGKLISVTKGGWVPVPPEYRSARAPPPSHFIHQLMEHLGHPYYVGFLSAAAIHGASHQAPMVFQVVTPAQLRDRRIGRGQIRFIRRSEIADRPRQQQNVPTGRIWVSTPEVTIFDLVETPLEGGGLSNVATVIGALLIEGRLNSALMASIGRLYPLAVVQRTGFLVDYMAGEVGIECDTESLRSLARGGRYRDLSPANGEGSPDPRWHIMANIEIEHDL